MIGVVWGIFIYITLAGAAKGLDNGFEKAFASISSNSLFIWGNIHLYLMQDTKQDEVFN